MSVLGAVRFSWAEVIDARKGARTQLRGVAYVYDPAISKRKLSLHGRARPGDLFWVGEPVTHWWGQRDETLQARVFCADHASSIGPRPEHLKNHWMRCRNIPERNMRRAGSRLTLEVTANRLEHLHTISAADAEASGVRMEMRQGRPHYATAGHPEGHGITPQAAFLDQWRRAHGKISLDADPVLAVVTFRLIEANVDQLCLGGRTENKQRVAA